jgi:hypothetical protein
MSIFASLTTTTVRPACDPSSTIVVQKLSGRALEIAAAAHAEGVYNGFVGRGWANKFFRSLQEGTATEAEAQQALSDPLAGYDRFQVVLHGIQSWSYTDDIDGKKAPKPVSAKSVGDINDDTLEELALAIMRLTKPHAFKTAEQLEAERKNG